MLNQIKIIDNELISTLIISSKDFLNETSLIENEDFLLLNKFDLKKINDFLNVEDDENKEIKDRFIGINYQENKFSKEEIELFMNWETTTENLFRIIFINHKDLNSNFDFLMNETLVLMIDKKINLNNL